MSQATETRDATALPSEVLTVEQFLRLPEIKPALEFIGGRVVQKVSPKARHSVFQSKLCSALDQFLTQHDLGMAFVELRCTFAGESIVPDVCVFEKSRVQRDEHGVIADDVFEPPDLLVEVHSPKSQTVAEVVRKIRVAISGGVRLAWLVQPAQRQVQVFRPGQPPEVLKPGQTISGETVVPGFSLTVDQIFAWVDPA